MSKFNFRLGIFLVFFLMSSIGVGQEWLTEIKTFSTEDGLSTNHILKIFQDQKGFIWVGTKSGVHRFDGSQFQVFFEEDSADHSSMAVELKEDVHRNIWVSFIRDRRNVARDNVLYATLIDSTLTTWSIGEYFQGKMPFLAEEILEIKQVEGNVLFLLTNQGQLFRYNGEFELFASDPDWKEAWLWHYGNSANEIGVISNNKLVVLGAGGKPIKSLDLPITGRQIENSVRYFNWFHPYYEPLVEQELKGKTLPDFQPLVNKFIREYDIFPKVERQSIYFNNWKLYQGKMILKVEGEDYLGFYNEQGNLVADLSKGLKTHPEMVGYNAGFLNAEHQQFWYGFDGGLGVVRYKQNPFQSIFKDQNFNATRDILKIPEQGKLVFLSMRSLNIIDQKTGLEQSIPFGHRIGLLPLDQGTKVLVCGRWGTKPKIVELSLTDFDTTYYGYSKNFNANLIFSGFFHPFQVSTDRYLLGSQNGLLVLNREEKLLEPYEKYNEFEQLKTTRVNYAKNYDGKCWLATSSGLYVLDPEEGITAHHQPLPNLNIYHFHREGDEFWLATYGQGLVKWNSRNGKTKSFKRAEGLLSLQTMAVYPDTMDNLWISSEMGLVCLNKTTEDIKVYLERDGITHNEFNRYAHFQSEDGKIYMGGLNGITAFYPVEVLAQTKDKQPKLQATRYEEWVSEKGEFVDKTSRFYSQNKIELAPGIHSFNLFYSPLDFTKEDDYVYSYKIEGWQEEWITHRENFIKINQLPPGKFELKIKAKCLTEALYGEALRIPIVIQAPFYEKIEWQLAGVLIMVVLSVLLIKWRDNLLYQQQLRLESLVNDRTKTIEEQKQVLQQLNKSLQLSNQTKDRLFAILAHDLRNPVLSFKHVSNSLNYLIKKRQTERIIEMGSFIEREATQLYHLLDNLLQWALSHRGELPLTLTSFPIKGLVKEILDYNQYLCEQSAVQLTLDIPDDLRVWADSRVVETVLRNLVSNALKFIKKEGTIRISAKKSGDLVEIKVEDNGIGIKKETLDQLFDIQTDKKGVLKKNRISIGLHLCKELLELIGGTIKAESKYGQGTTMIITLQAKGSNVTDCPQKITFFT